jgi:hypothetical protein
LQSPTGVFVSNHRPNLSGNPAPNIISSNCDTTPGASCQISFTLNGVTKSLPIQSAGSSGTVYWTWSLQDIGITSGSWSIKAISTLGSQTTSTNDAMNLEVSQ